MRPNFTDIVRKNMVAEAPSGGQAKPPPGFTPIPGSKHGGFHKRSGAKWEHWYPLPGRAGAWCADEGQRGAGLRQAELDRYGLPAAVFRRGRRASIRPGEFSQ